MFVVCPICNFFDGSIFVDPDDEDYTDTPYSKPKRRRPRTARRSGKHGDADDVDVDPEDMEIAVESESSDGDWLHENETGASRRKRARRRTRGQPKKRQRVTISEEDEVARTARINMRTGQTINYAEGNPSDSDILDSDDAAAARAAKEYVEDENVVSVERVCDYRPTITQEEGAAKPHSVSDFDANTVEYKIKWTGKSYRRSTWHKLDELRQFKGIKKVLNYVKAVAERRDFLNSGLASPEEREESIIIMQEHRDNGASYEIIDRVVAERPFADDPSQSEYLVKWKNLPYADCTWEPATDLNTDADLKALDAFSEREQAACSSKKKGVNPFNVKDDRPRFRRMLEQPEYLHGEGRKLREYQLAGLNWLSFSWTKRNNVILADEMGLGKTLQTISFLGWLMYVQNIQGPFLVVVPLSTSAAWVREFQRWLPDMNVVQYSGDGPSRAIIREHEFWPSQGRGNSVKFHTLLTTPELVMQDEKFIDEIRWAAMAVDEAHRLKNEASALHETLKSFRSATRLLITGTPLQNSVRELWALLHFLNPDVFSDAEAFEEKFSFSALRDPDNVSLLHNTLRPYIIRRQKTDVEKSLPKKSYAVLRVGMSSSQQDYYKLLLTKNFAKLNAGIKGRGTGTSITLRNLVMELKKCCNHPFLFPSFYESVPHSTVQSYIRGSGKMILLDKLLLRLREKGHRVLIFSQMVSMLDILQEYCRMRGFPHQRLDGTMHNDIRQRAIDHYNAPGSTDYVFLLSTRAGGLGINLATADTVIIFDSDWNPQNDLQAESRAHRIGQKKDVKVFRLLTRESVEEDILERAKRKRVLEHLVIHGVEGDEKQNGKEGKAKVAFKKEELSAILRFGAEKLFEKDRVSALGGGAGPSEGEIVAEADTNSRDALASDGAQDDEKAEEKRVLEVDDIDELLARVPVDEADEVGAAEPSVGDSLLNAFKWADFKTVEEEDDLEPGEIEDKDALAKDAARGVADIEDRRERDILKAKDQEAREREMLKNEGDSEFWGRVIPEELKDDSHGLILGTRRRSKPKSFGSDSPQERKRRRMTRAARNSQKSASGELTEKELRSLLKGFRRFGDPRRISDVLRDSGLENRIDEETGVSLLEDALRSARQAVEANYDGRLAENGLPANGVTRKNGKSSSAKANGASSSHGVTGKEGKGKGAPKIAIDILGETNVDALELIKRCSDLQLLGKQIARFDEDTRFRLQRPTKAPSYGVRWMPQQDAMLLVGVYRHGFGNWSRICDDAELHLGDKMNIPGNEKSKKGAPDSSKLSRRVLTLLRDLERDAQHSKPKSREKQLKPRKGKEKSAEKKKRRSSGKDGSGRSRDISDRRDGKISKKTKDGKKKKSSKSRFEDSKSRREAQKNLMTTALKATHSSTLRELKLLSTEDSKMDKSEKISRTKQCLLKLGRTIDKQAGSSARVRNELWSFVHQECRTSLPGERLSSIYEKLATKAQAESAKAT